MIRSVLKLLWQSWLFLCLMLQMAYAQHTVTIEITQLPDKHAGAPVFITGNFNKWIPAEAALQMQRNSSGQYTIALKNIKAGLLEFKFNRGNWQKLECTAEGRLINPKQVIISSDTVISTVIHGWRDDYPVSTALPQVQLLDSAFFIPHLNVYRGIWIYLPEDYNNSGKKYPVLYMHDGQDLFDEATSEGRIGPVEWGVDETIERSGKDCIVVAINHAADKNRRIREYFVHPNTQYDTVYGKDYLRFIVETLKPYIDKHYRTLPGKATTFMAGSSMGGLLTLYAGLLYPDTFGALGVFSPSVWLDEGNSYKEIAAIKPGKVYKTQRYYFYGGGNENRMKPDGSFVEMSADVNLVIDALQKKIRPEIKRAVNPEGRHGQWYWGLAFPGFYEWLIQGR
ncbi:MAG: alpha/beta hydrolase [Chitinophagaceae bacterium]|nr:alpha/beta hydrolase [Chitinophagaceae bacterium]